MGSLVPQIGGVGGGVCGFVVESSSSSVANGAVVRGLTSPEIGSLEGSLSPSCLYFKYCIL